MKRIYSIGGSYLGLLLATLALILVGVNAEGCSTLNQCATGCCNKGGYCGIGDDYCGADCVANCDYQPECDASKPCTKGCCNQYGYCGLGPDCKYFISLRPSRLFYTMILIKVKSAQMMFA